MTMADRNTTQLTELTSAAVGDKFYIVDVSEGVLGDKYITKNNLLTDPVVTDSIGLASSLEGGTAQLVRKVAREVVTLTGATSVTTFDIPIGAVLLAASFVVNVKVSDDTADPDTWSAAFSGGSTTALVSAAAAAKDTIVNKLVVPILSATNVTNVTFTPQGGSFDGGEIEVVVYYDTLVSPAVAV
jgi:hypothetical protein